MIADMADGEGTHQPHKPVLDPAPLVVDAGVTLWCGRCQSVTLHQIGHLPSVELGAPKCVICRRWVGFECTTCGAIGDQRRPPADTTD
jgi:hypothetical protein